MNPFRNGNNHERNYPTNDAPLLENQLQNLDMELQILKRQREIIFKQREVESKLFNQRLNTFNQPNTSFEPEHNYNTNYSGNFNSPNPSKGFKRSSGSAQDYPAPKQSRPNDYGGNYNYGPNLPSISAPMTKYKNTNKPLNKKPIQPQQQWKNPQFKKDFQTIQPKPNNHKNFQMNQSVHQGAENKISANAHSPLIMPQPAVAPKQEYFLRPGTKPHPTVTGRLELALGEILKEIKTSPKLSKEQKIKLITSSRNVKELIRERIRNVMMNKLVIHRNDTIMYYRKSYPTIDKEMIEAVERDIVSKVSPVVNPAKTETRIINIDAAETERARIFFKSKINILLQNKMQDMIDKLFKMYGDNETEIIKCIEDLEDLDKKKETEHSSVEAADKEITSNDGKQEKDESSSKNVAKDVTNAESDDNNTADLKEIIDKIQEDKRAKVKKYYKLMDLLLENRLPKMFYRYKDEFMKIMDNCGKDFVAAKETIISELKDTLRKSFIAANSNSRLHTAETNIENTDYDTNETLNIAKTSDTATEVEAPTLNQNVGSNDTAENEHIDSPPEKMDVDNDQNQSDQRKITATKPAKATAENTSQMFVMLLGRPCLPAKPLIYDFLNNFNPKSIKKHKSIKNLLVIGFENNEDYTKILAANETKVGDATFIIRANEVISSDKQKEEATHTVKKDAEVAEKSSQKEEVMNEEPKENKKTTDENKRDTEIADVSSQKEEVMNKEPKETENTSDENKKDPEVAKVTQKKDVMNKEPKENDEATDEDKDTEVADINSQNKDKIEPKEKEETAEKDKKDPELPIDIIKEELNKASKDTEDEIQGNTENNNSELQQSDDEKIEEIKEINDIETTEESEVDREVTDILDEFQTAVDELNDIPAETKQSSEHINATNNSDKDEAGNINTEEKKDVEVTENIKNVHTKNLETIKESDETGTQVKGKAKHSVATPTRSSSRLANVTPSTIRTRRASRLAQ